MDWLSTESPTMTLPRMRGRRYLALGLAALLPAGLVLAQARQPAPGLRSAAQGVASPGTSFSLVHDGDGLVTLDAERASVREVLRILCKWFDLAAVDPDAIPDVRRTLRFERMPVTQVVRQLLVSAGRGDVVVPARLRRLAPVRPSNWLMMVHDGRGTVTVAGEQASTREVLAVLSRWFDFPIVNPQTIPDARRSMQFAGVPVGRLVDALLHPLKVNYVILTNAQTLVPTKVVAAPVTASAGYPGVPPGQRGNAATATAPIPGPSAVQPLPANDSLPVPMPMPTGEPPDVPQPPAMVPYPLPPTDQPQGQMPVPIPVPSAIPAPTPGASRPGMTVPSPTPAPPRKPPG